MNLDEELMNRKRSQNVITWSALYLAAIWLSILGEFLNPNSDVLKITDLLYVLYVPAIITAFILTWRWLRSIVRSTKLVYSAGVGYRQGWAFWGWVTPFALFWIPRRLVERSQRVFTAYLGEEYTLRLGAWWGLFVATVIIDNFSFRAFIAGAEGLVYLDMVSAVLLTIAFPKWKLIVETVTNSQQNVIYKIQAEGPPTAHYN
jgi:hypothetical protein